jgi:molybdopterin guanine dinucleotide-containing S/N-oxide reductase-like protein
VEKKKERNQQVHKKTSDKRSAEPAFEPEKTVIRSIGLGGTGAEPIYVDVKDGKIIRMRPVHYEDKYSKEELAPTKWKIEARGKTFESPSKAIPGYLALSYKKMVNSPNRVKYPLKRVDWDPDGERNPQNRGKSKYKRISWDEATDIIVKEIKRVQETYGPYGILIVGEDGHAEAKNVHLGQNTSATLLHIMQKGGYTSERRNADSWEGWYWGTMHVWGTGSFGLSLAPPKKDTRFERQNIFEPVNSVLKDVSEHTDMIVWQGADTETTPTGFAGYGWSRLCYWFTELGIKQVWVAPDLNYAAAIHASKWIPILPNTDAALSAAIVYTWIDEGTYDKDYIATHAVGFDKVEDYVMGREDGVPKTPEWASKRCGIPEWTIKALAREWTSQVTSLGHFFGGPMIRGPYAHETARFMAVQLGMQGMGNPGVHQIHNRTLATPGENSVPIHFMPIRRSMSSYPTAQIIPRTLVHKAILEGSLRFWGSQSLVAPVEDQFKLYEYPIAREKGGSEIHMMWSEKPCNTSCWNNGNLFIEAVRNPKIECFITNSQWLQNDCQFSDLILPVTTQLEEEDIQAMGMTFGCNQQTVAWIQKQAIEPIGESKSDYLIACEVAKKLGIYDEFTQGLTVKDRVKLGYDKSVLVDHISWEDFNEKQYWVAPIPLDWEKIPPGLREFYEDPEANPLGTPSGKLEFYSQKLAEAFPDDKERNPYPKYIMGGPGWSHDESLDIENGAERCKTYPLVFMSNHPRFRLHSSGEGNAWLREIPTCKVKGHDGYSYEPLWIHPETAKQRGIKHGDIVKVYNERGTELFGAYVTERIIPGAVSADHGAHVDQITDKLDRGGSTDLISPTGISSKYSGGMVVSGYLVEAEKVDPAEMESLRKKYPEAFARDYDPAYGLTSNAWIERDK